MNPFGLLQKTLNIGLVTWKEKGINTTLMNNLITACILFFTGQCLIWVQSNGQFLWPWWKRHPVIIAFTLGGIASYLFIKATYYAYTHFEGLLWPGRFIGFGFGMLSFALLTFLFMHEGVNLKTIVSLMLACALIGIQLFWK